MIGHGSKFGRKMEQAIAALLSHRSLEEAAPVAGISVATLKRWMRLPEFKAAHLEARRDVVFHPAELWRRGLGTVQTDGGPHYATVGAGAYGAVHLGVCQPVSGTGRHRGAHRTLGAKRAAASRQRSLKKRLGPPQWFEGRLQWIDPSRRGPTAAWMFWE
jgi:hypothetical protein